MLARLVSFASNDRCSLRANPAHNEYPDKQPFPMFDHSSGAVDRLVSRGLVCVMAAMCLSGAAQATEHGEYPKRPITLVVPYPPGGSADVMARMTAQAFTVRTGHAMTVDNRGGAGGNIAAEVVARAAPDGYTLIMGNAPILAINPHLYSNVRFDPVKDFEPVLPIAEIPLFLIVRKDAPYKNVKELIAAAQKNPGAIPYASGSTGSTTHLGMELFKAMAGVDLLHVPYRGSGPALAGISAGDVPVMFELMPSALPVIDSGRVVPIAATTRERSKIHPDIPTVNESGIPGFEMASWFGVLAPKGTPVPIVEYLSREIRAASQSPEFVERLEKMGAVPMAGGPREFSELISSELKRWGAVVKDFGAKVL